MGGFRARFEANAGAFGSCRFSFNDTATTEIYTLSLHDALPIYLLARGDVGHVAATRSRDLGEQPKLAGREDPVGHADPHHEVAGGRPAEKDADPLQALLVVVADRLPAFASEPGEGLGDVEAVAGAIG